MNTKNKEAHSEIEELLLEQPGVAEAAVHPAGSKTPGGARVGRVFCRDGRMEFHDGADRGGGRSVEDPADVRRPIVPVEVDPIGGARQFPIPRGDPHNLMRLARHVALLSNTHASVFSDYHFSPPLRPTQRRL